MPTTATVRLYLPNGMNVSVLKTLKAILVQISQVSSSILPEALRFIFGIYSELHITWKYSLNVCDTFFITTREILFFESRLCADLELTIFLS